MKIRKKAFFLTGSALVAMAAGLSMPAFAQETVNAKASDGDVVVVTGTRIRRPNLKSASPITSLDEKEVRLQGATAVDAVLKALPQIEAGANENQSNGSDGTAGINLRSLGGNRSLVLIDGQRFLPQQGVDLNFIPSTLIERADVLTGGASSVYGSDAMSGVVNFIMRKNLNGVRVDAQYSMFQHTNDDEYLRSIQQAKGIALAPKNVWTAAKSDFNIAMGANLADGRGNVTGYFGYRKMDPVTQDQYDYSNCALFEPTPSSFDCGGSGSHAYGRFTLLSGPNSGKDYANAKDGSKTWALNDTSYAYNYAPLNYTQRESQRYQAGGFITYNITDSLKYTGSAMFMDDHSESQAAPSAIWSGRIFNLNCDNPLMGNDQKTKLCGSTTSTATQQSFVAFRAASAGVGRRNDMRHTDYRFTSALHGDLSDAWSFDASVMYAKTIGAFNYQNDINQDRAAEALQAVTVGGQIVCKGGEPGCVPLDVFSSKGPSAAAYHYIFGNTFTRNEQDIRVVNAYVSGDLGSIGVKSPWANDGLAVVFGFEDRVENFLQKFDATQIAAGSTDADGRITSKEWFTEVDAPIVSDVPGIKQLNLSFGYRTSTFGAASSTATSADKKTETYKIETRYSPTSDVLLRASYNKAMRTPNTNELFAAQSVGNVALVDPCSHDTQTATIVQCRRTGVTDAQYNGKTIISTPADVGDALGGGNPNLDPETAKTTTYGIVFTPRAIRNFSASVDYFKIHIDGYIGTVDPTVSLSQCLTTGNAFYCGLIHRAPTSGVLFGASITTGGYVIATNINTGFLETTGLDFSANYGLDTSFGALNFAFVGTALKSLKTEVLPGLGSYDCAGLYGGTCGQPSPKWRHNLRTTWTTPWEDNAWVPASLSLNWRYWGKVDLSRNTSDPFLGGTKSIINAQIKAYSYYDLVAVYNLPHKTALRIGINNVLDKAPPAIDGGLLAENGNGNTYPSTYDPLGRMVFINLSTAF